VAESPELVVPVVGNIRSVVSGIVPAVVLGPLPAAALHLQIEPF